MEPSSNHAQNTNSSSPGLMTPLARDSRGSLEVFNPSTYSSRNTNSPVFRSPVSWQSWVEPPKSNDPPEQEESNKGNSKSERKNGDEVTTWMALKDPTPPKVSAIYSSSQPKHRQQQSSVPAVPKMISSIINIDHEGPKSPAKSPVASEVGNAAQRAAEWGLVLKTDSETGKPQGVKVRTSSEDQNKSARRDSGSSVRSSGELSDDGEFLRVSEDLKDALSTFQQTFVVSNATNPDYPILYASTGFFKMTGYTSKEVIGRNWYSRFLQGSDKDPEDVAKIREALQTESGYCGRFLNYKKGFWKIFCSIEVAVQIHAQYGFVKIFEF